MSGGNVRMEWRKGANGDGDIYIFSPKPSMTREEPAQKQVEFDVPLADGVVIQDLGRAKRTIELSGTLVIKERTFEAMEDARRRLTDGIGRGPGQLHLISLTNATNSQHIFYRGQLAEDGLRFKEQQNPFYIDYELQLICADPADSYSSVKVVVMTSDAKVV